MLQIIELLKIEPLMFYTALWTLFSAIIAPVDAWLQVAFTHIATVWGDDAILPEKTWSKTVWQEVCSYTSSIKLPSLIGEEHTG